MVDRLTREQRSALMARVRSCDTKPECGLRSALHRVGLRFRKHVRDLPGRPDAVFARARVAVFVDGDFLARLPFSAVELDVAGVLARENHAQPRARSAQFCGLAPRGWKVVRVWEHDIDRDVAAVSCASAKPCAKV